MKPFFRPGEGYKSLCELFTELLNEGIGVRRSVFDSYRAKKFFPSPKKFPGFGSNLWFTPQDFEKTKEFFRKVKKNG